MNQPPRGGPAAFDPSVPISGRSVGAVGIKGAAAHDDLSTGGGAGGGGGTAAPIGKGGAVVGGVGIKALQTMMTSREAFLSSRV